jgi:sialic acid synthase SpsE
MGSMNTYNHGGNITDNVNNYFNNSYKYQKKSIYWKKKLKKGDFLNHW